MQKLINKVAEAKKELGCSTRALSELIGFSKNYLSESMRLGRSTETQNEIVKRIDNVLAGGAYKSKAEVLNYCLEQSAEIADENNELRMKLSESKENERNFRENFIQMQKRANVLNTSLYKLRIDCFLIMILALALGLMFGFILGVRFE